jgi:hypothetical protein
MRVPSIMYCDLRFLKQTIAYGIVALEDISIEIGLI